MTPQQTQVAPSRRSITASNFLSKILSSPASGNGVAPVRKFADLRIVGDVDLSRVQFDVPLVVENCEFRDIDLSEATVPQLVLSDCQFHMLTARHVEVSRGDLDLHGSEGTMDISGAHVRDDVHLESAKPEGTPFALRADGINVGGDFVCRSPEGRPFICGGTMSLDGAKILGNLHIEGAHLNGPGRNSRPHGSRAFSGVQLEVGGEFEAECLNSCGDIYLIGLQVAGELDLSGADIASSKLNEDDLNTPTGAVLDRCHIRGSLFCDRGFSCVGGLKGIGSTIDGSAYFNGATLTSPNPAGQGRALELQRSHIGGNLDLCHWRNPGEGQVIAEGRWLRSFDGAWFTWNPAYLTFACNGVVSLAHVTVACQTRIDTGDMHGREYPLGDENNDTVSVAADLSQLHTQVLLLEGGPRPDSRPPRREASIDLTGATLGTLLDYLIDDDAPEAVYPTILKGCTYSLIHQPRQLASRLAWLDKGSTFSRHMQPDLSIRYRSGKKFVQPYQQVADASGRAGHDADSRTVMRCMYRVAGRSQGGGPSQAPKRAWSWIQDVTIGFGYKPGRAAMWLLVLWLAGGISFSFFPPEPTVPRLRGMSIVEHIIYPLDLMIPITGFGEQAKWQPVGIFPELMAAALIAFGWIFSITVLAAITRTARRS